MFSKFKPIFLFTYKSFSPFTPLGVVDQGGVTSVWTQKILLEKAICKKCIKFWKIKRFFFFFLILGVICKIYKFKGTFFKFLKTWGVVAPPYLHLNSRLAEDFVSWVPFRVLCVVTQTVHLLDLSVKILGCICLHYSTYVLNTYIFMP